MNLFFLEKNWSDKKIPKMEQELSLLSPPATPPLDMNKVSQSTSNATSRLKIDRNEKKNDCEFEMYDLDDKGYTFPIIQPSNDSSTHTLKWSDLKWPESTLGNVAWKKRIWNCVFIPGSYNRFDKCRK